MRRHRVFPVATALLIASCASAPQAESADASPSPAPAPSAPAIPEVSSDRIEMPGGTDIKARYVEFSLLLRRRLWDFEDEWVAKEQGFQLELRKSVREAIERATKSLTDSPDWKRARTQARDAVRSMEAELRQKTRVHREELELELLRFFRDREGEVKTFAQSLDDDLKQFKGSKGYQNAQQDAREIKEELLTEIRRWHGKIKDLKTKEGAIE
jgi:hypothetical protein